MSRITIPSFEQSAAGAKPLLEAVNQQLGIIPNLMKLVGNSPAALEGYLSLNGALAKGKLNIGLREKIALAIAEFNACEYCLAAHSYISENMAKIEAREIQAARNGLSSDAKTEAALQFALNVAANRGKVSDDALAALRSHQFSDAEIVEIVLNVSLNLLTNYINNVAQTDVDFPKV